MGKVGHACSRGPSVIGKQRGQDSKVSLLCPFGEGSMSSPGLADKPGTGREATATGRSGPQGSSSRECWVVEVIGHQLWSWRW